MASAAIDRLGVLVLLLRFQDQGQITQAVEIVLIAQLEGFAIQLASEYLVSEASTTARLS
jgi:hypothetical protein